MRDSARTSGIGTMVVGGTMQGLALLLIALMPEPFPIALILMGGGVLLFIVGAVLHDQQSDIAHRQHRPPESWGDF